MRGLNYQTMHIPLAAGLAQKDDPRAVQPPALSIASDIQFDEHGGVQARYPFETLAAVPASVRKLAVNGDELLAFTADTLYSYDAGQATWRERATHLAVKVDETPRFVTTGDQINCDRAELGDTVFYAWEDTGTVYVATIDKTTGAITSGPLTVSTALRPRLVALSTKVLLFYVYTFGGTNDLQVYSIDPTTFAFTGPSLILGGGSANLYYDACAVTGADQAVFATRRNPTTSYTVGTVTAGLVVASSAKARTCDGPIAVAVAPASAYAQIVRANGTNIQGDLLSITTLADVYIGQAIGTVAGAPVNQIAAAFRSVAEVTSGEYRCYAFWSAQESTGSGWQSKTNWVDTASTVGVEATFIRQLGIASRAFDHNGRVFVVGVYSSTSGEVQLQNTHFLYRDDGFLVAKATPGRAGGLVATTGLLPGIVAATGSTFSFCSTERRIVPIGGGGKEYADRGPRDISFTFDSDEARRCVRLGKTLYITGGEILQYDGVRLTEVGFHIYPCQYGVGISGSAGSLANGEYFYKATLRWDNAVGEIDRSTTATIRSQTVGGGPNGVDLFAAPIHVTHKTTNLAAFEWWRSQANAGDDSTFHLVTSKDPSVTAGANKYLSNTANTASLISTLLDTLADSDLTDREQNPEVGEVLESISPPAATIIASTADRLFLAGVAGDPDRVWYSKQRGASEVAAFNEALTADVPHVGGAITALGFLNDTLIVFRARAIYALAGDGFDNVGGGQNYGPARSLSHDVGAVNHESVASTPEGIVFKSSKGWHLLDRGWNVKYIGGAVSDYDDETITAVHVIETRHQIRACSSSRMLVFDYLVGQWVEWTQTATTAAMWRGQHVIASGSTVRGESDAYADPMNYGLDIETAWIKPAELQGFVRVTKLMILGELRSLCKVRVRVAYDYNDTYVDDKTWDVSPTTIGGPLQVKHGPRRQQCQALKVRITAVGPIVLEPHIGEAFKLTGLALDVGLQQGLNRKLPAAQRQ